MSTTTEREQRARAIASALCAERAIGFIRRQHAAFVDGSEPTRAVVFEPPSAVEVKLAEALDCQCRQTALHRAVSELVGICDSVGPGVNSKMAHRCLNAIKALLAAEQRHAHAIGAGLIGPAKIHAPAGECTRRSDGPGVPGCEKKSGVVPSRGGFGASSSTNAVRGGREVSVSADLAAESARRKPGGSSGLP